MYIEPDLLVSYLHYNPSANVELSFPNGDAHDVKLTEDGRLYFPDRPQGKITVSGQIYFSHGGIDTTSDILTLNPIHVQMIKDWHLQKEVSSQLKILFPAAKEMLNHYDKLTPSGADKRRIRVFMLKDVGFAQAAKGHVLITPTQKGEADEHDIIKGYITIPNQIPGIRYETVQAWRYRELTLAQMLELGFEDWLQITMD